MNKISPLHRLYWEDKTESYMFDGCMRSVMEALGEKRFNFDFFAALTGDFFTQMYDPSRSVDSLTQDFFAPEMARNAFSACGYACEILDEAQIAAAPDAAFAQVQRSVERGVPVIARGIGPTQAFSLVGGFEDDGGLLANIWDMQKVGDADGYVRVEPGFPGVRALIFAGEKVGEPALPEVFKTILDSIPKHITRAPKGECRFGRQAFLAWAEALLRDETFAGDDEAAENARARLHDAPLIMLVTNASGVRRVFGRINADHPELGIVRMLAPVYADIMSITAETLRAQGEFFVPPAALRERDLRQQLADGLKKIADCILAVYDVFCE